MKTLLAERKTACKDDTGFWLRLLSDPSLDQSTDLEKLLAGCEIIAALDDLGLLAA